MGKINILGVKLDNLKKAEARRTVENYLSAAGQHQVVTPNAEIILAAGRDQEFLNILNQADLAVADGVALKIAGWLKGRNIKRIAGADLLKEILELAQSQGRRVAVFNWQGGLSSAEDIRRALAGKYPNLRALAVDIDRQVISEDKLNQAKEFKPEIIFLTLGAPWQEKFIFHNLSNLPSVKIGLGVGGAFDFLTGKIKRAPKILRTVGLEWLWRLIKQPRRWKRIYNAVMVFPVKFLVYYFKNIIRNNEL